MIQHRRIGLVSQAQHAADLRRKLSGWPRPADRRSAYAGAITISGPSAASSIGGTPRLCRVSDLAQTVPSTLKQVIGAVSIYGGAIDLDANISGQSQINVTTGLAGQYGGNGIGFGFWFEGSELELKLRTAAGAACLIKVDDAYLNAGAPYSTVSAGYIKLTFGSWGRRRIDIIGGAACSLECIRYDATGNLTPARVRGPRCIVVGDSFTASHVTTGGHNIIQVLRDHLGWDDIRTSSVGGTGILATNGGAALPWRSRMQHDVYAYGPDVVIWLGSVNDHGLDPAAVAAEAALLFGEARAALPNTLLYYAPTSSRGVGSLTSNALDVIDAAVATAGAAGVQVLPLVQLPLVGTPASGTLRDAVTAGKSGAEGIYLVYPAQADSVIEIGSGATRERIHVDYGDPPYSTGGAAARSYLTKFEGSLRYNHAAGEPWKHVGSNPLTGVGYAGATTGRGICDWAVQSDGVHPTVAANLATPSGAAVIGAELARLLMTAIG